MSKKIFLVEIGTEELPPKILRSLAEAFYVNFIIELNKINILYKKIEWFATPRRLALKVIDLIVSQENQKTEEYKQINTQILHSKSELDKIKKYQRCDLNIAIKQNNFFLFNKGNQPSDFTCIKNILQKIVIMSLAKLPIQKLMRWSIGNIYFVRPVHTVTLLLNNDIISTSILGIQSDNIIYGHRFIGNQKIIIDNANQYPQILFDRGKVIADYEVRKTKIKMDVEKAAYEINGNADLNENLLEEVTSLVEWPIILTAKFATKFLSIPEEILIYIMKNNQKCFPIYTNDGKLLPNFIFVANIESRNPQEVIFGNERIMHARLADVEFLLKKDRKKRLEDNLSCLESIIFQKQLGTLRDKTNRITKLSRWIAQKIGANIDHTIRASLLSKCDLATSMVLEFTNTKGMIGMHYARQDGEDEDVAIALNEQYQPRFANDKLPSNLVSCSVAIADKIDTLVGIFGISQHPKNSKDPFSLRRTALGILRIIVDKKLNIDLQDLIKETVHSYNNKLTNTNVADDVIDFMFKRFHTWYQNKGYSLDIIKSVLACHLTYPVDFDARVKALSYFITLREAPLLISINKRIDNIIKKSNIALDGVINTSMLKDEKEIKLANNLVILRDKLQLHFANNCYKKALVELTTIHRTVNEFFENVIVNVEDKEIRNNRLNLLFNLRKLFLQIADISLLNNKFIFR